MKEFKMTPKLKIAKIIYNNNEMTSREKINSLNEIKNLNDDELKVWVEDEILLEGVVGTAMKLGYASLIGGVFAKKVAGLLNQCKITCKEAYKQHQNKNRYANCLENCNNKVARMKKLKK